MNILIDALPCRIDGVPINSNFRNMVLFEQALSDPEASPQEQLAIALTLLYRQPVTDLQKAVDGLLWFYRCGAPAQKPGAGGGGKHERAYDFDTDAPLIYAAFRQSYGIDLNAVRYMHWWKFRALMDGLPEDTRLAQIMQIRLMDISDLKGKEKTRYRKLKEQFKLQPLKAETLPAAAAEQAYKERMRKRAEAARKWTEAHKPDMG